MRPREMINTFEPGFIVELMFCVKSNWKKDFRYIHWSVTPADWIQSASAILTHWPECSNFQGDKSIWFKHQSVNWNVMNCFLWQNEHIDSTLSLEISPAKASEISEEIAVSVSYVNCESPTASNKVNSECVSKLWLSTCNVKSLHLAKYNNHLMSYCVNTFTIQW